MKIQNQESISEIFSIFHDGVIACHRSEGNILRLEIEIRYLAKRINPAFSKFFISLFSCSNVRFTPWQDDPKSEQVTLTDPKLIFAPRLDILEGNLIDGQIQVVCNQPRPGIGYCGGELYFNANFAQVIDEAAVSYSIEDLAALSKGYWDEWASKNKA